MAMVFPNTCRRDYLRALLAVSGNKLKLFANNTTITDNTVVADFTEVTGGGYADYTLLLADWNYTLANPAYAQYSILITFTFTGATGGSGFVYGYWMTDTGGTKLLGAENITRVTPANGVTIQLNLKVNLAD